jgi:phospholipid/cholesterol/gamma-HCH transport system substrate-binding protein
MHTNRTVEILIGAAVVVVAVLFVVFAYRSAGSAGVEGYELTAKVNRVDGIAVGTDVRLAGIKIGTVKALTLDTNYLVNVTMDVHRDVKVPEDSSLVVTSAGLLSSSYLSISPGGSDKMLPPGGAIKTAQGSIDMMSLIARFAGGVGGSSSSSGTTEAPQ